jgi:hypothetical protein
MKSWAARIGSALLTFLLSVALVQLMGLLGGWFFGAETSRQVELSIHHPTGRINSYDDREIKADITNLSDEVVTLVVPGDGSEVGWRTPIITWTVVDATTDRLEWPLRIRCGNQNALGSDEVIRLAPGETRELDHLWLPTAKPGKYKVALTYENRPGAKWRGWVMGLHNPIAMLRLRNSTRVVTTSNVLTLEVADLRAQ